MAGLARAVMKLGRTGGRIERENAMCDCDCDQPDVYRESFPRARKQYQCCECRSFIQPGDQYQHVFGVWDGDAGTFKTCLSCAELIAVYRHVTGECLCHCQLRESIQDYAFVGGHWHSVPEYHCVDPWTLAKHTNGARAITGSILR